MISLLILSFCDLFGVAMPSFLRETYHQFLGRGDRKRKSSVYAKRAWFHLTFFCYFGVGKSYFKTEWNLVITVTKAGEHKSGINYSKMNDGG